MKIEKLNWDSNFFDLQIGKIILNESDVSNFRIIKDQLDTSNFDVIYIFSNKKIQELKAVDQKRIYICQTPQFSILDDSIIDYNGNPNELYELAYQAGHKSRFKIDPNISDSKFKKLYRLWVDNSLNRIFADYVKVYLQEGKPQGFITAKKHKDKIIIGLIAVNYAMRGKGIGKKLITSIIDIAKTENLPIEVATQVENTGACKFYERQGFIVGEEYYIYHFWNKM